MYLIFLVGMALADTPTLPNVSIACTRDLARVTVQPPAGQHIEADSPVSGWLEPSGGPRWQVATDGRGLSEGLLVAVGKDPRHLASALRVSLCSDTGNTCRPVDIGFDVDLPTRKGTLLVTPYVPREEEKAAPTPRYGVSVDAAMAKAKAEDKRVLIDFGAVWCPPCNLLAATVLEDPANAPDLAGFVVVGIDSDAPESWTLKSRYHVTGYPTIIATNADGTELDRLVGFDTEPEFLDWLHAVGKGPALSALPAPGASDPSVDLAIALRLLGAGREAEAGPYLDALSPARAPALQDNLDLRTARFLVAPSRDGLLWLLAHGAPVSDWMYAGLDLCAKDAELRAAVRSAVELALPHATPTGAADLLDGLGTLSEQDGGKDAHALWISAALLLESAVNADPSLRRAYGTSIAELYARGGALDEASRVLREDMTIYPAEFTWPYALADLLLDAGKPADALEYALAAQTASYGDNRLRAVDLVARVMDALGRGREALGIIDEAVANAPKPGDDLDVRTHRYLQKLADTRASIAAKLGP